MLQWKFLLNLPALMLSRLLLLSRAPATSCRLLLAQQPAATSSATTLQRSTTLVRDGLTAATACRRMLPHAAAAARLPANLLLSPPHCGFCRVCAGTLARCATAFNVEQV